MLTKDYFNKDTQLSIDTKLRYLIIQSNLAKDWLVFKKTVLGDKTPLFGTLVGIIFFFFCHEEQRKKSSQTIKKYFPHINFSESTPANVIRFILQIVWLSTVQSNRTSKSLINLDFIYTILTFIKMITFFPVKKILSPARSILSRIETSERIYNNKFEIRIYLLFTIILAAICISIPFTLSAQITFSLLLLFVAVTAYSVPGRLPRLLLLTLSLTISSRYLWWRYSFTLNIDNTMDVVFGIILMFAETYAWLILVLGFFQIIWPLDRKPIPLPEDTSLWPSVDIFIPTYNEPLDIVKTTTFAALDIDWPKDKLNVFILDDGNRLAFKVFATEVNAGYITRDNNIHAKAGNINQALKVTTGDYIAIFDCDHVPVRSFLQVTMGSFLADQKLALVQTPHHFYSPDPFERNLSNFKKVPNENHLFYSIVQSGNDLWNAAFFCGSCSVLKRNPLLEIGGIATETVTEDAHTALRLHRKGYSSAYLNIIQAAGLATESLSAHIGQRIRWARGMAQIFRIDNPLFGKGLSVVQRLCYTNAMIHFFGGIPRLIFLLAPLGFLFFHSYLIYAPAVEILFYAAPMLIHANIANSYIQGKYRHSFWAEIYESVLAWYIARPTTMALISPKTGKFNVTVKGGLVKSDFFDLSISKPYLSLITLNVLGIVAAVYRYFLGPSDEQSTIILNFVWTLYNLILLGGAISVAQETKQIRMRQRVEINTEIIVIKQSGHLVSATMCDFSSSGLGLKIDHKIANINRNEIIHVLIPRGDREFIFPARITNTNNDYIGVVFDNLTIQQQIDLSECTYSRADAWIFWDQNFSHDKPISSIKAIIKVGFHGYVILFKMLPPYVTKPFLLLSSASYFIKTLLPKNITDNTIEYKDA